MNRKITKLFSVLAVVCAASVIFAMSSEDAPSSVQTGLSFAERLSALLGIQISSGALRTAAHFIEFAVLGFTLADACYVLCGYLRTWFPFIIGALLAVSDEIHQMFVPGRACQLIDIAVDSSGVILGIAAYTVLVLLFICISKKAGRKKHG